MEEQNNGQIKKQFSFLVQNKSVIIIGVIGIIFLLILVGVSAYFIGSNQSKNISESNITPTIGKNEACTEEAKICPDGSTVSRTGPNCEFANCPISEPTKAPTKQVPSLTPTPTVVPTIALTPTPTIPRIQTYSTSGGMIYKNNVKKFSFQYLSDFSINSSSSESFVSFLQKQGDLTAQRMAVEVMDNSNNRSLDEIVQSRGYESMGTKESTTIDGHTAILIVKNESQKDFCNQTDETKVRRIKVAIINGAGYALIFLPTDTCDTFKTDWFGNIPLSTRFY